MPAPSPQQQPPSTPPNKENAEGPRKKQRRSARVLQHDPIVAPGFGTRKDLEKLAGELSEGSDTKFTVEAVELLMRARGRGIRGSGTDEAAAAAPAAAAPINAWADFMKEEGVASASASASASKDTTTAAAAAATTNETPSRRSKAAAKTAASAASGAARVYDLPLAVPRPSKKAKKTQKGGILVQAGTLDSAIVGRSKFKETSAPYHLFTPTRIFNSVPIAKVFTSSNAVHSIAIAVDGTAYGWGRNESGQIGPEFGDDIVLPERLDGLATTVHAAACGKSHTLFHLTDGSLWAAGANKSGQCGVRTFTDLLNYRKCVLPDGDDDMEIAQISCGEDFSVLLSTDGYVYTTGSSEFGQLGNGKTGEYFISANKLAFENCNVFTKRTTFCHAPTEKLHINNEQAKVVPLDEDIRIGQIATGKHHTLALEAPSNHTARVFSWGCGNYGTLGHGVQADEYFPRLIGIIAKLPIPDGPLQISAGATCSLLRTSNGHIYYWGKHRSVGEATMRPSLVDVLANNAHNVTQFGAGAQTVVCSTSNGQTVAWGQGAHGELGLETAKSSAKPTFVNKLDKCLVNDLACGYGHTLYVLRNEDAEDKSAAEKLDEVDEDAVQELIDAIAKRGSKKRG